MRAARNTHAPSNGDKWTGETRGTPSAERGQTDTGARHGANGNNRSVVIEWEMPGKMVGPSPTSLWLPRNRTADDDDDDDDARRHAAQEYDRSDSRECAERSETVVPSPTVGFRFVAVTSTHRSREERKGDPAASKNAV
ncbi:uncharacterized protein LOC143218026 isoform X1 [Lasioglossum baleicum]|uniref:uncharacterized protein LOC143218026 isoform X1 n=1 Tax=Lasioglossum baleicum TaxID=434251 RepID=UPI003FCD84D6